MRRVGFSRIPSLSQVERSATLSALPFNMWRREADRNCFFEERMQTLSHSMREFISVICVSMPRRLTAGAAITASMALCGCATGLSVGAVPADVGPTLNRRSAPSRGDVILPAEIQAASRATAYDAVLWLRPRFFTSNRSAGSGRPPIRPSVVLERGLIEPIDVLRLVPADVVAEIHFVEADEARVKYGPAYTAGIIVVRLRASP